MQLTCHLPVVPECVRACVRDCEPLSFVLQPDGRGFTGRSRACLGELCESQPDPRVHILYILICIFSLTSTYMERLGLCFVPENPNKSQAVNHSERHVILVNPW